MANLTITVDVSKAVAALGAVSGPTLARKLGAAVRETALLAEREVVSRTPVKTGALRASIHAQQIGTLVWKIASPLGYAPIVEEGSKPHLIRPRSAKRLAFVVGGRKVFARAVHHPGTRPRRMFALSVPPVSAAAPAIVLRHLEAK